MIDSIVFNIPEILIGNRGKPQADITKKIVLLDDLEKLYSSIYKSPDLLQLQLFKINEGKLVVRNETNLAQAPPVISHIHFSINKLRIDSASVKDSSRFIFLEQVLLCIAGQKNRAS